MFTLPHAHIETSNIEHSTLNIERKSLGCSVLNVECSTFESSDLSAFTLLETLIALLIATILITVSARGMMSILQADAMALRLSTGACVARTVTCEIWLDQPLPETICCGPNIWNASRSPQSPLDQPRASSSFPSRRTLDNYELSPRSRPSYSIVVEP